MGLTNLKALQLVDFFLKVHYTKTEHISLEKKVKNFKYPLVALNDRQAVVVAGKKIKVMGTGKRVSFNGFEER